MLLTLYSINENTRLRAGTERQCRDAQQGAPTHQDPLQKRTGRKSRLALFPIVSAPTTVRGWRSLHGSRHCPNGTGLSSAIMAAPLVAAPSTRAPDHLAPQHCAVCAKSVQDTFKPAYHKDSMGVTLTSYAHSVTSTECAYGVEIMTVRSLRYQTLHKVHHLMHTVDDGGPTACRARR